MECEIKEELASKSSSTDDSVSFPHVTAVASGWMLDFMFVSLCRSFKEGNFDEFNETLSVFEALFQSKSLKADAHNEKSLICAFLARVMHGKHLDVLFEKDEHVMPLMSAATVWSSLENVVEDEGLFKEITILLFVQAVAVCLEKGQRSSASSVLKWFEKRHTCPRNLGIKLSTIVTKADTYHPVIMSFSYNRLLETIHSFLDNYLKKNPCDFLLKTATGFVQSSRNMLDSEPVELQDSTVSEKQSETTQKNKKTKRKLLSTKLTEAWSPDTTKKLFVSLTRLSGSEVCHLTARKNVETSTLQNSEKYMEKKTRKKWTAQLDKYLRDGVKRHGQGNWSRILLDYDFEGRTGTMLKDRWRVLLRNHKVG
ncbi:telomeric repeat-binding factor 1 [Xiphophorus maculatus]|uniref:Telomeric repeat-binding factor n=1 Tax=Xiphophorus maculatus TaxID=8083 RepID=A0A3B5Q8U7_XIPMA|nr:telomeric repeat-binding factor 1 [Xiphophorus maculatus]